MKNNLENSIKESLEQFELPYNASAWDAMSKKLDATQPAAGSGGSASFGKWIAAAGIVTVTTLGVLYLVNSNNSTSTTSAQNTTTNSTSTSKDNSTINNDEVTENLTSTNSASSTNLENVETVNDNSLSSSGSSESSSIGTTSQTGQTNGNTQTPREGDNNTSTTNNNNNKPTTEEIIAEKIITPEVKDGCEGETITVKNDNDRRIRVVTPVNDIYEIQPKSTITFEANASGVYKVEMSKVLPYWKEISSFNIGKKPNLDFTSNESTQYEDGIPSIPLMTYSEGTNLTWSFEGLNQKQYGNEAYAHFYTKGRHKVTLTAEGTFGCKTTTSKTVEVFEDYNLFAPTAFIPGDANPKNAQFMPMALTVRDVQFTMIIIDPKSGNIVYETNNASQGWDGIDKNTGQMTRPNTAYIWKVVLKNPEPGERSEYSGTITRL